MPEPLPDASPRRIRALSAVVLVVTFLAGGVTGAGLHRWLARPPPPPPFGPGRPNAGPPMPPFVRELGLTREQQAKTREILDRYEPRIAEVMRETFPRMKAITDSMEEELRQLLTEEQRRKFDEIRAQRPPGPPPMGRPPPGAPPPFGGPPPPFDGPPPPRP